MNEPATVTERPDGYVQDEASQRVVSAVEAGPGDLVLDLCAAPGGKATAAGRGRGVGRGGRRPPRACRAWSRPTPARTGARLSVVAADGTRPPWRASAFDRVLVDAPCSGLGTLRRRADLRWRVDPDAVARLAALQRRLLGAAADLVRPGGVLVYSVCTLTVDESLRVDEWLAAERPDLEPIDVPAAPWAPWGRGAVLLPQAAGTDGMCLFRYRRSA